MNLTRSKMTPPEVARLYRVSPDKVLTWIRTGELRAVNIATRATGRPRYVVDTADLAAFEQDRALQQSRAAPRRRKPAGVIEFF